MKRLCYFLTCLVACLCIGINTYAADKDEINLGEIKIGETYNMKDDGYFYSSFTATENGFLHVYSTNTNTLRPFKEWAGTAKATMALSNNNFNLLQIRLKDNYSYNYEFQVTAGTTYYFCGSTMKGDNIDVTFKMEKEKTIEYLGASPEEGSTVSPTVTSSISFSFNRSVVASAAVLRYGDNKEMSITARSSSYACTASADIKDALVRLANDGLIKEGDEFTVVLKGVKEDPSDITDGSEPIVYGDVSATVKLGALPAMLQSITLDGVPVTSETKFLTYYAEGTGVLTLTFTKPLRGNTSTATLRFGDLDESDNGGYYQEYNDDGDDSFTLKTTGNKIIIDFSGKRRNVNDMVTSTESKRGADFTKISLEVSKVTDLTGVKAYTTSSTTAGRFNYTFTLDVPEANVSSEFTPANGASIKNEENIEIWIDDEQSLKYDGIKFSYEDENGAVQDIIVKDYTREKDEYSDNAVILTVAIPEAMKTTNNVIVSLNNVTCVDGKDYSTTIAAKYNPVNTGINGINATDDASAAAFNLNGQAATANGGIIITKGKKVLVK